MSAAEQGGRRAEIWSSVEYAGFGRALARELGAGGLPTQSHFQIPQLQYWQATGAATRLRLRASAYGFYPLRLLAHLWRAKAGLIPIVSTNTFYAPAVAALAGPRRFPVVHWVLDLYPDVLLVDGKIARDGLTERGLSATVAATLRRSAANVFLGRHLLAHAESRFGPLRNARVIPVGADGAPFRGHAPRHRTGAVEIMYSGNLGRMHDIRTIEAVLRQPLPGNVRITFRANGAGFRELRARLEGSAGLTPTADEPPRMFFGGSLGDAAWVPAMLAADVALVTLRPGAEGLVMPSKTYSALVAGQAILAVCPSRSDLADTIREHECGWIVEPGDVRGLRDVLARLAGNPAELFSKRQAAFAAGHRCYDQSALAVQWRELIDTLAG
jgi:glycosyltransferase involved in cell wall biosynthesis